MRFRGEFRHLNERQNTTARDPRVDMALFAAILAHGLNLPLTTMAESTDIPYHELTHVSDWYLREETIRRAITAVVDYHHSLPLSANFGPGTTAMSDGIRFEVTARSLHAQYHARYFGPRRGVYVQRRMGDWYFETAQTEEDLVAAHEKWVFDYNFQKHLAHEKREDGRHSPAEVLGWVTGKQYEPDYMYRAFSAICETRTLTKAGYARFRDFLLYGERGLAGKKALINIFQDTLALEYGEHPLAKYSVEWQPNDNHLLRVGNPRLYDHPYQSPQLELWSKDSVEWFVIIQAHAYGSRSRRKRTARILVMQPPLLTDGTQG